MGIIEIWKDIDGYNGVYQVSNLGNVRRLSLVTPRLIRGYNYADLHYKGERKNCSIHRLVAKTFIKNTENKPQVNHIDGNKFNNNVNNLEWNTSSENIKHAYKTGLREPMTGENGSHHKITEKQAIEIFTLFNNGYPLKLVKLGLNACPVIPPAPKATVGTHPILTLRNDACACKTLPIAICKLLLLLRALSIN